VRWTLAGLLLLLLGGVAIDHAASDNDWRRYDRRAFGIAAIPYPDEIVIDDQTTVKLIGVDAPRGDLHGADQAIEYSRARLKVGQVTLRLEATQTRDSAGRLLAYVYLADNDCLNLAVIRDDKAYADRRTRHTFAPQYEQVEAEARKKARGIWKDLTEDQMPPWRRQWLAQLRAERSSSTRPADR
jgi:endonuclease YncB( thermonuclease family)